CSHYYGSSNYW
nr:immunoglobulin heavy chain junction region [Mus musculus]